MRRRLSLAGQLLALQLVIVCVVLVGVTAVSLAQSDADFRETAGRRALSVAETVAATQGLRDALDPARRVDPSTRSLLVRAIADYFSSSASASVVIAGADGRIIASPRPAEVEAAIGFPGNTLKSGRGWVGEVDRDGKVMIVAQVPVLGTGNGVDRTSLGRVLGVVAVSLERPSVLDNLRSAAPNLLTYLGIASGLGVLGSLLLARRVKRQTLGLEPREITGLVEHREALLHGIKEGVVALDRQHRVTLLNDEAIGLLNLSPDAVGMSLAELRLSPALEDVLSGRTSGADLAVPVADRVLILNRMPVSSRGRPLGSVTTLRDRTELITLQRELDAVHLVTETLRAQAHEFSNRLHTISGLIELGEYPEVARYVHRVTAHHAELTDAVTSRIADPAVAALLVAKASLAAEQGVELRISPACRMGQVDEDLSSDVATVVGNLVDNALDALGPGHGGWAEVEVREDDGEVTVTVRDCGPGVSPELAAEVFRRGFSTKTGGPGGQRGIGLALVRLICLQRGGDVRLANDGGAMFVARLPVGERVPS